VGQQGIKQCPIGTDLKAASLWLHQAHGWQLALSPLIVAD